jgi:hypothetical protein
MKKGILFLLLVNSSLSLFSQKPEYVVDTLKFDVACEYLINDTSSSNLWQIGIPNKSYFDSAFSKPFAIVTDTVNYYGVNNWSYFDLYLGEFNYLAHYLYNIFIEFIHKYDTDTLKDGGYITVSYDKGNSWINIINDDIYYWDIKPAEHNKNLYSANDTLFNGECGFSGKSNGWDTTMFAWFIMPATLKGSQVEFGDTMILRFNFISDSIKSDREGWMIDNISLYAGDIGGGGIHDVDNSQIIKLSPNPVNTFVNLEFDRNYKDIEIKIYNVKGQKLREYYYSNRNEIKIEEIGLESGFYFISVIFNKEVNYTKKIIVKK